VARSNTACADDGVAVDDASFIDTSFPGFVDLMNGAVGNGGVPALVAR
jgi:5-enolpyruvylshikimate-3-phosphate synthase